MLPRKPVAFLSFFLFFVCAGGAARADTVVLQNVAGTMTYDNWPVGDDVSRLLVAGNNFTASAFNNEVPSFLGFNNRVSGNTITAGDGLSDYMGQTHRYFSWSATFDGFNVTGSVRWINFLGMGETIHTFTFVSAGVLTTEALAGGIIRYTVSFAGPAQAAPVPEPATLLLLGTGLAGIVGAARRSRKKN